MIEQAAFCSLIVLGLSILAALWRILRGPSIADRVVGADALATYTLGVVVAYGVLRETRIYLDSVMALAILGFFGSVAMSKYLVRGRPID